MTDAPSHAPSKLEVEYWRKVTLVLEALLKQPELAKTLADDAPVKDDTRG
jgi:hypothetical protein